MSRWTNLLDRISGKSQPEKFEIGLVLSGGAARGFAHAGVLKALAERDMKPGIISGVSAGSIVGSFYCDGYAPEEICEIFRKEKIFEFVKLKFRRHGLFSIEGLRDVLEKNLRTKRLEDLQKPLIITATNINRGVTVHFSEGNLAELVVASSSLPVIFNPAPIDGHHYVDGGVTNNFPIEPLQDICKTLVGVHANPVGPYDPKKGLLHIATNAFHLSIKSDIERKQGLLDHFIEPKKLMDYAYFDVRRGQEMFDIGYEEAVKVLDR